MLTFVLALNNFAVPAILQVKVFPAEMWVRFNTTFDTAGPLQLSWPLVVAPLLLLVWFSRREVPWPRTEGAVPAKLFRRQLGAGWFWFCGAVAFCFARSPSGCRWRKSLLSGERGRSSPVRWPPGKAPCGIRSGSRRCRRPQSSLWRSATSAIFSAFLRVGVRVWSGCRSLVPGVLLGIGLIFLFNRPGLSAFYQSAGIVILALAIRYLGPGWTVVAHAARTTDRDLADAARLDGATRWQLLRHVQWPQIAPQTAAAWYVVFLLCLWDVESMILVVPPGGETLALRVFNLLHYGHNAQVNALCLTLLALAVLPLALWLVRENATACSIFTEQ